MPLRSDTNLEVTEVVAPADNSIVQAMALTLKTGMHILASAISLPTLRFLGLTCSNCDNHHLTSSPLPSISSSVELSSQASRSSSVELSS